VQLLSTLRGVALLRRSWAWAVPAGLIYAVCRVPSFFEPHWYTDEAGYATTARAILRGAPLYTQAWTNKPPIHLWTIALFIHLFGASEAGLHALTFVTGLCALLGVAVLARRLLSAQRAAVATALFALAIGLPVFQAQLAVPESLIIAPVMWAAVIVLTRVLDPQRRLDHLPAWAWSLAAGVLMGLALGIQQTALADALVFGIVIVLGRPGDRRARIAYVMAFLAVVAAWLLPVVAVAGAPAVAFALVGFYQGYVAFSAPNTALGIGLRPLGPVLALAGTLIMRRGSSTTWAFWLWACADLAVAAIANRPYPHFLVPALAPTILALASIRGLRLPIRWRIAPLAAAVILTAPLAVAAAGLDSKALNAYAAWPAAQLGKHRAEWSLKLEKRSPADEATAAWIQDNGLSRSTAVIWSSSAWLYLLADLPLALPTAPIYNDVVLFGSGSAVAAQVAAMQPQLIVTEDDALSQWPDIEPVLAAGYQLVYEHDPDRVYLRRPSA
jgi:4-amino-4-deoxy-L-arabinose transferase-like glycosyltransferase